MNTPIHEPLRARNLPAEEHRQRLDGRDRAADGRSPSCRAAFPRVSNDHLHAPRRGTRNGHLRRHTHPRRSRRGISILPAYPLATRDRYHYQFALAQHAQIKGLIDEIERLALAEEALSLSPSCIRRTIVRTTRAHGGENARHLRPCPESSMDLEAIGAAWELRQAKPRPSIEPHSPAMRRAQAGLQGRVHRTPMSFRIGVFTREKEGIFDGLCHSMRCIECSGRHVTVGAARELIGLPVVRMAAQQPLFEFLERNLEDLREGVEALLQQRLRVGRRCDCAPPCAERLGPTTQPVITGRLRGIGVHQVAGSSDGENRKLICGKSRAMRAGLPRGAARPRICPRIPMWSVPPAPSPDDAPETGSPPAAVQIRSFRLAKRRAAP